MNFYGINNNNVGTLFSSLNNTKNSSNNLSSITSSLSDYESIRGGTYKKLLQKYYASEDTGTTNPLTNTEKDSTKKLTIIKNSADDLNESAKDLLAKGKDSLFSSESLDKEKVYKAVKDFTDAYNSLINDTETTNTKNIATSSKNMINATSFNESILSDVGISIGEDYNLSIDKEKFLNADMNKVKTLFNGNGSFAYQTAVKSSMIGFNANSELNKENTYSNKGTYSSTDVSGKIYNSLF